MNPYFVIGFMVLWLLSLLGVGKWQNDVGHTAERVTWQERDNKEIREANAKILELEEAKRKQEAAHAAQVNTVATVLSGALDEQIRKTAAAVATGRRLRDPGATGLQARGSNAGSFAPTTGNSDGKAGGELSAAFDGFLKRLAGEADEVVLQLQACQAILIDDRSTQ